MNEFDKTYDEIDSMLDEGKLKSLATAGLLGLGALGGAQDTEASQAIPRHQVASKQVQKGSAEEIRKLKNPLRSVEINDTLVQAIVLDLYKWEIAGNEAKAFYPYPDSEGKPTIGIGHLIKAGEDYSNGITAEEVLDLFVDDIEERISYARRIFDNWEAFPQKLKIALVNGIYRGDIKSKHETVKLINAGMWVEASKEYLDHGDYRKSKAGNGQIARRMEHNSKMMAFTANVMR